MTQHLRRQIRDAAKILLAGLPLTGARVETGRTWPLPADYQPTLLIYFRKEASELHTMGEVPTLLRRMSMWIDIRVQASSPPDDTLDAIAFDVESALGPNQTFGGLAIASQLTSTESETVAEGERHQGLARLEFQIEYVAAEGSPGGS